MKKLILVALICIGCSNSSGVDPTLEIDTGVFEGFLAPEFEAESLIANSVSIPFARKPMLLNFWATWCGPCKAEMPDIQKLHNKYGADISIIGLSIGEPDYRVRAFVEDGGFTWDFYVDPKIDIGTLYEITAIPTTLFVDRHGVIVFRIRGAMNYSQLEDYAKKTIAN